jgi:hypothetical protein
MTVINTVTYVNECKIYQVDKLLQHFPLKGPQKCTPNWDFWFENTYISGNPATNLFGDAVQILCADDELSMIRQTGPVYDEGVVVPDVPPHVFDAVLQLGVVVVPGYRVRSQGVDPARELGALESMLRISFGRNLRNKSQKG